MHRPIPSIYKVKIGKNTHPEVPEINRRRDDDYEEKLKLAALLHDQGINPELWQEAEPAPWTAQKRFRETGEAPEDMFVAQGRLYRKSPAIAASRTQGAASLDAFLGEAPKPITDLVPVEKVQLRHPLGNKPDNLPAGDTALERYRRYAKLGVDPDHAYEGDAIPHHLQDGLKRAVIAEDGSEIPLGIPGVYRNPDDGMFISPISARKNAMRSKTCADGLEWRKLNVTIVPTLSLPTTTIPISTKRSRNSICGNWRSHKRKSMATA